MSLTLIAADAGLVERIRCRMAEGAAIRETAEMPAWLAFELGDASVQALFESEHAYVAILEDGRTVVRRARG